MSMGIVSDADFDNELKHNQVPPDTIPTPGRVDILPAPGRKEGDGNVPDSLRKIIGETAELEGRSEALELASHFGISPSSVSAYSNGSTSTSSMNKQPNLDYINRSKGRIAKRAMKKIFKALDEITDDKLIDAKATDLAMIARQMSAVVKEMEPEQPKDPNEGRNGPTFIIYSPQVKNENHYDTITARE